MEIQCPQCQRALTIADEYAGQLMQCPLCQGQFQAPSLASTPEAATPPPEPASPSFEPANDSYTNSPPTSGAQEPTVEEQRHQPPQQPYQQGPPGQYSKQWTVRLSLKVVPFIPPILLSVVFLLSFFPWFSVTFFGTGRSAHLWGLAFGSNNVASLMLFTIFGVILAWPISIVSMLVALNVIPLGGVEPLRMWRSVIVAGILLVGLAFFSIAYVEVLFDSAARGAATIVLRLAYRLAWLALLFLLLEFWLEWRRQSNKPTPKIELHF